MSSLVIASKIFIKQENTKKNISYNENSRA